MKSILCTFAMAAVVLCFSNVSHASEAGAKSAVSVNKTSKLYPGHTGSYFDWGQGMDGWGYCYEWASNGGVLNGGMPVNDFYCENVNPSYYSWGTGHDGYTYCYQFTPYGLAMNQGQPVSNYYCQ